MHKLRNLFINFHSKIDKKESDPKSGIWDNFLIGHKEEWQEYKISSQSRESVLMVLSMGGLGNACGKRCGSRRVFKKPSKLFSPGFID